MGRFDVLDDLEFEDLSAELLTAATGLPYRSGARGRDGGIDLIALTAGQRHEAQCKHYRTGSFPALRRAVRKEAEKLRGRSPELASYRFVCSMRLSHAGREELAQILSPWIDGQDYVLDGNDLERLLEAHPEVERRYVKLWFAGAGQLKRVLNARSYARSRALLADIRASMSRYVQTAAFHEAKQGLDEEGVLFICGAPGVGKTTLASLLVLDSLAAGYAPYEIVPGELSAAWDLLDEGEERQLFVFDDFFGEVRLESRRDADRDLIRFIGEVRRRPNARLVITSREYILQKARELSELLDTEIHDNARYLLEMQAYTRLERGRILYNHVWFSSDLDDVSRRALLHRRSYEQIVDHPNYNPRLIEWITGLSARRLSAADKSEYVDFCLGILDSPRKLWSYAFESGIDDAGRVLLFSLVLLGRRTPIAELETAFDAATQAVGIDQRRRLFRRTLAVLEESFLTLRPGVAGELVASALNPSLVDFVDAYLQESPSDAKAIARGIAFFAQANRLATMFEGQEPDLPSWLAKPLSDAFDRTILPAEHPPEWSELGDRLGRVLSIAERSKSFEQALSRWLPRPARAWVEALLPCPGVDKDTLATILKLLDEEAIDRADTMERLYQCVREQQIDLEYWLRTRWVYTVLPEAFIGLRWEAERERFEEWLVQALGEPVRYFHPGEVECWEDDVKPWSLSWFEWEPPQTLRDLAASFEVEVDEVAYQRAFEELRDGYQEELRWHERSWRYEADRTSVAKAPARQKIEAGTDNEDAEMAAIFDRLARSGAS